MKLPRRKFLRLAAGGAALPALSRIACAQTYPTRPIRWIVSFPAGGSNDIVARIVGQYLSELLGQQVVVENRAGAGGTLGMQAVLSSPPDGYTLGFVTPNNAINGSVYTNLAYDFVRDSVPVAGLMSLPNVLDVHPSVPARTVAELIAYAKANPGRVNMATPGTGTSPHVSGELFKMMTGVNMVHVPYRGAAPALTDLIGGQVQVMFDNLPSSVEHIKSGKIRALGVTTAKRADAVPDVPTIGESVPGYEANVWYGIAAPKGTPPAIVDKLHQAVNVVLADPRVKTRFAELGGAPMPMAAADFGRLVAVDTEKWSKVVQFAGIKPE
jgi:tripartite-type tricarboxylate transporter receptor subunit TctC